jgi:hypothetical protein
MKRQSRTLRRTAWWIGAALCACGAPTDAAPTDTAPDAAMEDRASPSMSPVLHDCIERAGVQLETAASVRGLAVLLSVVQARCQPSRAELEALAARAGREL